MKLLRPIRELDINQIRRVLKLVWSCSKKLTLIRLGLTILQAILPLIPMYLLKLLIDGMVEVGSFSSQYFVWLLVAFAFVKLLSIIIANVQSYVGALQADVVADYMSGITIRKSIEIDYEYFDSDLFHDVFQRAIAQAGSRPLATLSSLISMLQNVITLAAIVVLLVSFHWAVLFLLLFIAIPVAAIHWKFTTKMVGLREKQTQEQRKSTYLKRILTTVQDAKEVRIFGFGERLLSRYLKLRKKIRREKMNLQFKRITALMAAQSVESLAIFGALAFIVWRAFHGMISPGDIVLYYQVFQKGQSSIASFLKSIVSINENRLLLEHLFDFMDLPTNKNDPQQPIPVPESIDRVTFQNVWFTYPNTENPVLRNVSFEMKKGQFCAIVGENGSGKTTIVKLICRLYEVDEGDILINGISISAFNTDELRRRVTSIFQHFSKYNATVNENIHFADYHAELDPHRVRQAANQAHASEFISKLPNGFATQLGRSFRTGEELSGGQWQKIALSRAFYKPSDVIILDEPSSHIDPLAEADIFKEFKRKSMDYILLLISHRIYNLRQADHIIVLDKGAVVESGSHEELMNLGAVYAQMFQVQSENQPAN